MNSKKSLAGVVAVSLAAVMIGCESQRAGPLAPTNAVVTGGSVSLAPAGEELGGPEASISTLLPIPSLPDAEATLKATAPVPTSPENGTVFDNDASTTLTATTPVGLHVPAVFSIRFQLWAVTSTGSPATLVHTAVVTQGTTTTSYSVPAGVLQDNTTYAWRVRAELDGAVGPWSSVSAFETIFVRIDPPIPNSPVGGVTIDGVRPSFSLINGAVVGDAGTVIYEVQVATNTSFTENVVRAATQRRTRGDTNVPLSADLAYDTAYYWRARGTNANVPVTALQAAREITTDWSKVESFRTPEKPKENRAPDPAPGQRLPLPNMFHVVQQVAADYPGAVRNSCQEHGGTWEFMDRVVEELRKHDTRWGYNCKRGNCPDISLDVVDYHYGPGPDQGSTDVYIIDILLQHCGSSPTPAWIDQTELTRQRGTVGRWVYPR